MRAIVLLFALLVPLPVLHGQTALPRVDVQVEVEVVEVDVIVTDRRGNPVPNLKAEDFTVLENGRKQWITNVIELRDEAAADGESQIVRPANIVIFFDALTTPPQSRSRAVQALEPLLKQIRPIDEVMVVSWNRTLDIVVPPTSDVASIAAGLAKVPWPVSRGGREGSSMMDPRDLTIDGLDFQQGTPLVRASEIRAANDAVSTTTVVQSLVSRLSGAEGRKIFFLISDGLELERAVAVEESDLPMLMPRHRRENFDDRRVEGRRILEEVTNAANASGVTFYTMKPAGLVAPPTTAAPPEAAMEFDSAEGSLIQLAQRTGGRFVTRTNDLAGGVGRIARELTNYYSVAYQPLAGPDSSKPRKLLVRTSDPNHVVRARRSVSEPSRDTQLAQQVVSNAFFPLTHNDLKIALEVQPAVRTTRNRMNVDVDVVVPYSTLAFVSSADTYEANLTFYVATADERDNASEVRRFDRKVTVTRDRFSRLAKERYVYGFDLSLESIGTKNRVTVGVIDQLTKITGFAVAGVSAPPLGRR
jgi:VWFA-related protein